MDSNSISRHLRDCLLGLSSGGFVAWRRRLRAAAERGWARNQSRWFGSAGRHDQNLKGDVKLILSSLLRFEVG